MAGGTTAVPAGVVSDLLETAEQEGSLTVKQSADILDTEELPVDAEVSWSVGAE
jgi:hypothetical protein